MKKNPKKDPDIKRGDSYSTHDLDKIYVIPGLNVRIEMGDILSLAASIKKNGLLTPLLVRRNKDPNNPAVWDLIGGHRRVVAMKQLYTEGWEGRFAMNEITCSDEDLVLFMALDNAKRKEFTAVEWAEVVIRMERQGWSDKEIAEKLDHTPQWVSECRDLYMADASVKNEVRSGLSASVGAEIARAGDGKQQVQILEEAKTEAVQMAEEAKKPGKQKGRVRGRRDWRQNMGKTVGKRTGKKLTPGKKLMCDVKSELSTAVEKGVLNGDSKMALIAIEFALGEITVDQFRSRMGYTLEDVAVE